MCGIFGVVVGESSKFTPAVLESTVNRLFKLSESRGKEASGLAFYSKDTIQTYKRPYSASYIIKKKEYKDMFKTHTGAPLAIIGHSRLVTQGRQEVHHNNQPVVTGGLVGIHNGIVTNDEDIWKQFPSMQRQHKVDSEALFCLIRKYYTENKTPVEAVQAAFSHIQGASSIAVLFDDINHLALATNNGSLYICTNKAGNEFIFASEQYILNKLMGKSNLMKLLGEYDISHVKAGSGCLVNLKDLSIIRYSLQNNGKPSGVSIVQNASRKKIVDIPPTEEYKPTLSTRDFTPFTLPKTFEDEFPLNEKIVGTIKRCSRCILPETIPFIEFDEKGVCNYCRYYTKCIVRGKDELEKIIAGARSKDGELDCVIAISGGRDSSYALHYIKTVLKMNPITYTYDWGMITDLARRNISRLCGQLGVEHLLISADINWKRSNIRKNVKAWFKRPDLGMIPLFMAGDKPYFIYANKLRKQLGINLVFLNINPLETAEFKYGFAGVKPFFNKRLRHALPLMGQIQINWHYGKEFILNPSYINASILDTLYGYASHFLVDHHADYVSLFHYVKWDETEINETLINKYGWEVATDTKSTWRIGDGTTSFYNYIYYTVAGLTENDTFRSNQVREGVITREQALAEAQENNRPRYESIKWYCDTIGIDFNETIKIINSIPKLYS